MGNVRGGVSGRFGFKIGDVFERALNQAVQTTIGAIPAVLGVIGAVGSGPLGTVEDTVAVGKGAVAVGITAGIATLLSLIKNLALSNQALTSGSNLVARFLWTFVFAFVAALPSGDIYLNLEFAQTATLAAISAGIAAVVSLAKNLTAEGVIVETVRRTGNGLTDSLR